MKQALEIRGVSSLAFASVLRAAATVLAGDIGFTYDHLLEIRSALSQMYDLFCHGPHPGDGKGEMKEVSVLYVVENERIEITLSGALWTLEELVEVPEGAQGIEIVRSLTDDMEVRSEGEGRTTVRIAKDKPPGGGKS